MTSTTPLIRDFMTSDPYAIDQSLTVSDAADRMRSHNIHHLLVLEGQALRGVVALNDLHLALSVAEDDASELPVANAVRPAMVCSPYTYLTSVLGDMEARRLDHVVIVDDDSVVAGIFTLTDALRAARSLANRYTAVPLQEVDRGSPPPEREQNLPNVRVKRMLKDHHAGPESASGLVMGKVMG